jgi:hypothetical protein
MVLDPPGHSEVSVGEGEYANSPRHLCSPPARKHQREKNSTDSELTTKRVNNGEKIARAFPCDDIVMEEPEGEEYGPELPPPRHTTHLNGKKGGVKYPSPSNTRNIPRVGKKKTTVGANGQRQSTQKLTR